MGLVSAQIDIISPTGDTDGVINLVPPTPTTTSFNNNTGAVNRTDFWDNLDTPGDINIADLNLIGEIWVNESGDTMTGNLSFSNEGYLKNVSGDETFTPNRFNIGGSIVESVPKLTRFFGEWWLIEADSSFSTLNVANIVSQGNQTASFFKGNGGLLTNILANNLISQMAFKNETNLFESGTLQNFDDINIRGESNDTTQLITMNTVKLGADAYLKGASNTITCTGTDCFTLKNDGSIIMLQGIKVNACDTTDFPAQHCQIDVRINGVTNQSVIMDNAGALSPLIVYETYPRGLYNFSKGDSISCYYDITGGIPGVSQVGCSIEVFYE